MAIGVYEHKRRDPSERFARLFTALSPEDCWLWQGCLDAKGYGSFNAGGRTVKAHAYSYTRGSGPIPTGLVIDHLCRSRACVNPQHLEPVSARTNILRGQSWSAINARKTHCPQGHPLEPGNLRSSRDGRRCLECRRMGRCAEKQRYRARKRQVGAAG